MKTKEIEYNLIDVVKLILAIFVVALHTHPFQDIFPLADKVVTDVLARIAVPYFFAMSSYFFFFKYKGVAGSGFRSLYHWAMRLIRIYIIWTIIYFPFTLKVWISEMSEPITNYIKTYIFRVVMWGGDVSSHLWFLTSLVVGVIIVWLLKYCVMMNTYLILGLSFVFYGIGILISTYCNLSDVFLALSNSYFERMLSTNGLVFSGWFWTSCGLYLAEKGTKNKQHLWVVICATVLYIIEATLVIYYKTGIATIYYFTLPLVVIALATLTIHYKTTIRFATTVDLFNLRALSLLIYIIHPLVKKVVIDYMTHNNLLLFFLTLMGTTIIAIAIIGGSRRFKWLKYLYS